MSSKAVSRTLGTLVLALIACDGAPSEPLEARVAEVLVTPVSAQLFVGGAILLEALAVDASGDTLAGVAIAWSSDRPDLALVEQVEEAPGGSTALVSAEGVGVARITARVGEHASAATLTVEPAPSLTVSPEAVELIPADTLRLLAFVEGVDAPSFTWSSTDTSVVTVAPQGAAATIRAEGLGEAWVVVATRDRVLSDSALVLVTYPAGSLVVSPRSVVTGSGAEVEFAARLNGNPTSAVTWTTRDTVVARVDEGGLARGYCPGETWIVGALAGDPTVRDSGRVEVGPLPSHGPATISAIRRAGSGEHVDPAALDGTVEVSANLSAFPYCPGDITGVQLLLDSTVAVEQPYEGGEEERFFTLDTTRHANGSYSMAVRIVTARGTTVYTSSDVPVTIAN